MGKVRIIIYPKDVQEIYGLQVSTAQLKIIAVKRHLNKRREDVITVHEYADFHKLNVEHLLTAMNSANVREYISKLKEKEKNVKA